jgi:hypothetical protein
VATFTLASSSTLRWASSTTLRAATNSGERLMPMLTWAARTTPVEAAVSSKGAGATVEVPRPHHLGTPYRGDRQDAPDTLPPHPLREVGERIAFVYQVDPDRPHRPERCGMTQAGMPTPSLARATPARHPSPGVGQRKAVLARCARNRRLADACYLWAVASLTAGQVLARSMTSDGPPATPTTEPLEEPWPTAWSAFFTAVSVTVPSMTKPSPGSTGWNRLLDSYGPWDV